MTRAGCWTAWMTLAMVKVLPEPVMPEENLVRLTLFDPRG